MLTHHSKQEFKYFPRFSEKMNVFCRSRKEECCLHPAPCPTEERLSGKIHTWSSGNLRNCLQWADLKSLRIRKTRLKTPFTYHVVSLYPVSNCLVKIEMLPIIDYSSTVSLKQVDTNVGRICARLGWLPLDAEKALEVCAAQVCVSRDCSVNIGSDCPHGKFTPWNPILITLNPAL